MFIESSIQTFLKWVINTSSFYFLISTNCSIRVHFLSTSPRRDRFKMILKNVLSDWFLSWSFSNSFDKWVRKLLSLIIWFKLWLTLIAKFKRKMISRWSMRNWKFISFWKFEFFAKDVTKKSTWFVHVETIIEILEINENFRDELWSLVKLYDKCELIDLCVKNQFVNLNSLCLNRDTRDTRVSDVTTRRSKSLVLQDARGLDIRFSMNEILMLSIEF